MIGQTSLPVEPWLKFLSTTAGRDKFYRTVQYLARFLAYYLSSNPDAAKRFQALSLAVGLGRKLFRIGKPLDHLQTILKSLDIKDEVVRTSTILKSAGYGTWLLFDCLQWLNATKVIELGPGTLEFVNTNAPRLWLLALVSSFTLNMYKLQRNFEARQMHIQYLFGRNLSGDATEKKFHLDKEAQKLARSALSDMIDMIIPLSITGFIQVSPGVVGLAGTITSLIGAASLWPGNE